MYLLDTSVVSELRRPKPHGAVMAWLAAVKPAPLYLSAITLGEIQIGIERTREHNAEKAARIENWAGWVCETFPVLPVDERIMRGWARLTRGRQDDHFEDRILAVTAMMNGLIVATRNVRDFAGLSLELVDPFSFAG